MNNINELLASFKKLLLSGRAEKSKIVDVLNMFAGGKIEEADVVLKNKTIYIKIHPIIKNNLIIKQEEIFKNLKDSGVVSFEKIN